MAQLATALQNTENQAHIRQQAGIQLKNCLTGQHDTVRDEDRDNWVNVPEAARNHIKNAVVSTLGTEQSSASTAAQVPCY